MIVIDTNVVSQLLRRVDRHVVLDWLNRHDVSDLYITAISVMEIRRGIDLLPDGRRRREYDIEWSKVIDRSFLHRTLPFDAAAADVAGRLSAQRSQRGIVIDLADTQIAAIAIANNASIATRNVRHFSDLPVAVIDPWTA